MFQVFQELLEQGTIAERWKKVNDTVTPMCKEKYGFNKHKHKEWITPETQEKVEDRNKVKAALNNGRRRADKQCNQETLSTANRRV